LLPIVIGTVCKTALSNTRNLLHIRAVGWAYAKKYDLDDDLNFEVHHVIPVGVLEKNEKFQEVLLWAEKNDKKFDFNSIDNGIPLQKKKAAIDLNGHANHPEYDKAITKKVTEICNDINLDDSGKFEEIQDLN
jgi:A nuclease family of the HNH/ENDO VII superfamily with conserved AHH